MNNELFDKPRTKFLLQNNSGFLEQYWKIYPNKLQQNLLFLEFSIGSEH